MPKITGDSKQFQNGFINKKIAPSKSEKADNKKSQRSTHDYLIKSFLSNFVNRYLFKKLNELSKNCHLGKIYKSNYKINIKPNEHKLSAFLEKTVKDIYTSFNNKKGKEYKYQEKNYNLAKELYKKVNISKNEEELKKCLDSTIEAQLILYYESDKLQEFKNKKLKHGTPVDYDKNFYKERNRHYYLLEPYGFIRYAKTKPYCHNERENKSIFNMTKY